MPEIKLPRVELRSIAGLQAPASLMLINRSPGPGETDVPLDSLVALEVICTDGSGIQRDQTKVWVNGVLAFEGGAAVEIVAAYAGTGAQIFQPQDTLRVVLAPLAPFSSLEEVSIRVAAVSGTGRLRLEETYSFTAEDRTAPKLVAGVFEGPRTLVLSFDETVEVTATEKVWLGPQTFPSVTPKVVELSTDGPRLTVRLDTEPSPGQLYEVQVVGVADRYGNLIQPPFDRTLIRGYRHRGPSARDFRLWTLLPRYNRRGDQTGDLRRFIDCLQEVTDLLLSQLDRFEEIFDIGLAPEYFVDLILRDLGNPFQFELSLVEKRRLAGALVSMYRLKGTEIGIKNAIRFFLGIDVSVVRAYAGEALVLGESQLGIDWVLGPSERFLKYAFDVEVPVMLTGRQRTQLRALVEYLKPAHTHFMRLIEPVPPANISHWEVGLSRLGEQSVLH